MSLQLNRISVRKRVWAIVGASIACIVLIQAGTLISLHDELWREKRQQTRQIVDSAHSVLAHYHRLQQSGALSEAQAQSAAIGTIKAMRYDGVGYFWLNDLALPHPRMIMHPTSPHLDGLVLDSAELVRPVRTVNIAGDGFENGGEPRNLFVAFAEVARQRGEGFLTYDWPKPGGEADSAGKLFPKLSFVKKFEPWGWVLGSGIYVDDVESAVQARVFHGGLVTALAGILLIAVTSGLGRSIVRPLHGIVTAMREIGWGKGDLKHRFEFSGPLEIGELAAGCNDMLARLQAHEAEQERQQGRLEAEVQHRTQELASANRRLEGELAERLRAEEAMQAAKARLDALLNAASESVMLLAVDGTILTINAIAAQRFGHKPEDMIGRNFFDFMPPELAVSRRAAVQHVGATGEPLLHRDRRGDIFFENNLYPVMDSRGEVEAVAVYAKDATDQHQARLVEDVFRHLDAMLLKWQMNIAAVTQIFCDDILPVFNLEAAWIGRAEEGGEISLLAVAERGSQGFAEALRHFALRWDSGHPGDFPLAAAFSGGARQAIALEGADASPPAMPRPAAARAALLLPISLRGRNWGILVLYGHDVQRFQEPQMTAIRLASMAERLGASLESALQQEWLNLLEAALAGVGNAVFIADANARILWANPAAERLSGYAAGDMIGKTPRLFSSGRHSPDFFRRFWETLAAGDTWHGDMINAKPGGELYSVSQTVTPLHGSDGAVSHYVAVLEDITERKAMEERIRHSATYDLLTDLPNRGLFFDRLGQTLSLARRDQGLGALLFLDLDGFKEVNDQFGHAVGDRLLIEVARRLKGAVRESDTVARLGGDEFTVILPQLKHREDACHVANKILAIVGEPIYIDESRLKVGVSIGIAFIPQDGDAVEQLVSAADHAMYCAKGAGRNRYACVGNTGGGNGPGQPEGGAAGL